MVRAMKSISGAYKRIRVASVEGYPERPLAVYVEVGDESYKAFSVEVVGPGKFCSGKCDLGVRSPVWFETTSPLRLVLISGAELEIA